MPQHNLILHNGKVITLDPSSRIVGAIAIREGRISAVGASAEVLKDKGAQTRTIDLAGSTVVPGFYDGHSHMDREGLKARGGISLEGLHSVEEIVEVVRKAAETTPPGEWIVLMPMGTPKFDYVYSPEQLREGRFPTRHDLDRVAPGHLVYIRAPWGWWAHRPFPSVANTAALKYAGVTRETPAPYNTEIEKDENGDPTGVFLDRNFGPILEYTLFQSLPRFTYEDRCAGVRLASAAYSKVGTTSGYEGHGLSPELIQAYRKLNEAGDLTVRIDTALSLPTASLTNRRVADLLYEWADLLSGQGSGDDMFRYEGVCLDAGDPEVAKIIGQHYPYVQWAGHFYQYVSHDRFVEIGVLAAKLGLRMNSLVCYDLEHVLRAYEEIDKVVSIRDRRWVIIHVIDASEQQLKRIRDLGLVATVTPNFMYLADDRFGLSELRDRGVPIRELLDADIPVALSSDNVPYSMLWTMWEALARWDNTSKSKLGESRLTREEALRMVTQTGHFITWNEDKMGTLEVGKVGDVNVLDGDPLTCPEDQIKEIGVDYTFVGGRQVHGPGA